MKAVRVLLTALVAIALATTATLADPLPRAEPEAVGMSSARLARIAPIIDAEVAAQRIPGAVIAIARRGKLVYFRAFGYRDRSTGARMTTDTVFNLASLTKPLTAVGALTLYEEGKILPTDPVTQYFPAFAAMRVAVLDAGGRQISDRVAQTSTMTVQDLLRHTSGLVYGNRGESELYALYPKSSEAASREYSGPQFIAKLATLPLASQPGTVWTYSLSYDVLGLLMESVSGMPLGTFLNNRIFTPLGMTDTGFIVRADQRVRYAKALPIDPLTGNAQAITDGTVAPKFDCGGGCAMGTAADYVRFMQMLLSGGKLDGHRIVSRKAIEYMTSDHLSADMKNNVVATDPGRADYGYGLGVAVRRHTGIASVAGSAGDYNWAAATGAHFFVDPRESLAVVFLAQAPGGIRLHYRHLIKSLVLAAIDD